MSDEKKSRLIPVTKWNEYHVWPSLGGLRHLYAFRRKKKCDRVFFKAAGRVLIDEEEFLIGRGITAPPSLIRENESNQKVVDEQARF